jgi:hypothetical protein
MLKGERAGTELKVQKSLWLEKKTKPDYLWTVNLAAPTTAAKGGITV